MKNIEFTRINNDVNGNPRYVTHFLNLTLESDKGTVTERYAIALKRAKRLGGKKYHTKTFGGGIVFQSYNIERLNEQINELLTILKESYI